MGSCFSKMNSLIDKHLPLHKLSKREKKEKFKPWITSDITAKIKEKDKLYKRFIKTKRNDIIHNVNQLKNEITSLIRRKKKEYYNKYFSEHKCNLKKVWAGIKEIISINPKKSNCPTRILHNGKLITNETDVANKFNEYFTGIADEILKKRKYHGKKSYRDYLKNPLPNTLTFYECDSKEVENLITLLGMNKSTGPMSIPTFILQLMKKEICTPLSKIFNLSLKTGVHPDILKVSKTIPIFKKASKLDVGNYRPISLLSNINKLLEKLYTTEHRNS